MKVCYNLQVLNPYRHPLMPECYPWTEYVVEDNFTCPEGFIELPKAEYDALKASFDLTAYNAATQPTAFDIAKAKIAAARAFGQDLIEEFAVGNVVLNIVGAGKTEAVTFYLHKLNHLVENGSLYGAVDEINAIVAAGVPETLAPFVTVERLQEFKTKIETYLAG